MRRGEWCFQKFDCSSWTGVRDTLRQLVDYHHACCNYSLRRKWAGERGVCRAGYVGDKEKEIVSLESGGSWDSFDSIKFAHIKRYTAQDPFWVVTISTPEVWPQCSAHKTQVYGTFDNLQVTRIVQLTWSPTILNGLRITLAGSMQRRSSTSTFYTTATLTSTMSLPSSNPACLHNIITIQPTSSLRCFKSSADVSCSIISKSQLKHQ